MKNFEKKIYLFYADKIRNLITIQKIYDNDYIFSNRFKNDENNLTIFFTYNIETSIKESKGFPKNNLENLSDHCFMATLAVKNIEKVVLYKIKKG